ncbi:copper chaperone PCu(A)C [Advenella sp. RU8]|uniref:copper chaperone PCu(A)C n=1 Tax=Advenella sp. RU8 TaxID=3399575 RepID=UPI003AAA3750
MKFSIKQINSALIISAALFSASASAAVTVEDAWVRATVGGQQATGAFMKLTSDKDAKLVEAKSDISKAVEIHEMAMQDDVMKMRQIPSLDLPKSQVVELKPGSYHIMFIGLNNQVKENDEVALQLVVENADGSKETVDIKAPAKPLAGADENFMHGKPMQMKKHGH